MLKHAAAAHLGGHGVPAPGFNPCGFVPVRGPPPGAPGLPPSKKRAADNGLPTDCTDGALVKSAQSVPKIRCPSIPAREWIAGWYKKPKGLACRSASAGF
ncbi:MAG: hypothetical protein JXB15_07605 [Anaerolineales bacterium]|nr:hypothetical protein [Anaerolineales bacterium]